MNTPATGELIPVEKQLPGPVARRGIDEASWRTAMTSLFPGAKPESVLMVFDYCKARKLDPLKKPCHIVPMRVKNASGEWTFRDVVMPGIYEYRTTATRTGEYLGHSKPEYGPTISHLGTQAPEWCDITVYRWVKAAGMRAEFPVRVMFAECAATFKDKQTGQVSCNDRWSKAPKQMLTKCTEAAALREAFPDEFGGTHTADEMEGRDAPATAPPINPRGDLDDVDFDLRDKRVAEIRDIFEADLPELEIALSLQRYVAERLEKFPELYIAVQDELAALGLITKKNFKAMLKIVPPAESAPTGKRERATVLVEREPGSDDE